MSESASASEIQINVKGPSELKLQITINTDKSVLELKKAIADKSDVSADRQRLIYSGRVLKDEDLLITYKIQSGHTIHMVKGVSRSPGGASTTSSAPVSQQLPTMQTGQNPHDPLTQLNGHMGFGAMAGLNPFQDMGLNPNDPNMLQNMMNSPEFLQQMSSALSNPQIMDQIMAANPQMAQMNPQMRQMMQSDRFRQMMSNPETLRAMLQMSSMMGELGGGGGPFGTPPPRGPGLFGMPPPANPGSPTSTAAPGSPGTTPGANSMFDPAMMQQMMSAFGGGADGAPAANPFGAFGMPPFGGAGAFGSPASPADSRPPEARFETQLQQLQDMGFTNASQNVRALLATGGNVHAAIEYILGGGGL
jgi:ubiquilin